MSTKNENTYSIGTVARMTVIPKYRGFNTPQELDRLIEARQGAKAGFYFPASIYPWSRARCLEAGGLDLKWSDIDFDFAPQEDPASLFRPRVL